MKNCTDLKQSKKLAEILPLESADMFWLVSGNTPRVHVLTEPLSNYSQWESYPCWSLTALLGLIPNSINFGYENDSIFVLRKIENGNYIADYYEVSFVKDNPIDAVFEMILKLHKLNLL